MNNFCSTKGITLIALIVTIIILLILAGVALHIFDEAVVAKSEEASAKTIEATTKENVQLVLSEYQIERYSRQNLSYNLKENLENIDGVKNVKIIENNSDNSDYVELEYNDSKSAFKILQTEIKETDLLLKGNVKIGDYIEYPMGYIDVYTTADYKPTNGWRILDDGTISGNVRIISTGVPAKWAYDSTEYANTEEAVQKLLNCFNNDTAIGVTGEKIKESDIKKKSAESVSVLTLRDLNLVYYLIYNPERAENSIDSLSNDDDLFNLGNFGITYWLATESIENESDIYYITLNTQIKHKKLLKAGVRPVITIKEGLSGKFENNIWKEIN